MIVPFRTLTWPMSEACLLLSLEGTILAANPAFSRLVPTDAEVVGTNLIDLTDSPRDTVLRYLRNCARSRDPLPGRIVWRVARGETVDCVCSGSLLPPQETGSEPYLFLRFKPRGTAGNQFIALNRSLEELRSSYHAQLLHSQQLREEILLREQAEQEARKSEENFRTLFNESADPIFLVRPDGSIADVNDATCRRYGYAREQLQQMVVAQIDSPQSRAQVRQRMDRALSQPLVVLEVEHVTREGEIFPVEANVSSIVLNGEPLLISTCRDITERKRVATNLAAEKERLAVTLRSIGDGVIVTDVTGNVTMINKIAEKLTGWSQAEAQGRPLAEVFDIIHESTRVQCENPVEKVLRTGHTVALANHTALVARDGSEIIIADSAAPIRDKESRIIGVVLVFRDITAQYRTEQEMQKIQKLEALGMLAGGLAHDFNNILTSILGNVSLVKMQLGADHRSYARLYEVEKASRTAAELTQQLLTFAKGGAPIKKAASIAEIAKETCNFAVSGSKVKCLYTVPDSIWSVEVDKGQMSQVFNNLIINALHAMPEGGIVRIGFENVAATDNKHAPLENRQFVKITFQDEGIGITEAELGKIFEPYYTTKTGGSGLGLAMVLSIVHRHDGHISVESKPGAGTTFTIHIPACSVPVNSEKEEQSGFQVGQGHILVMDDEEFIRDVAANILEELGYQVGVAQDGREAIEAYLKAEQEGKPYDVVVMDLTVPGGMGGKEAITRLLSLAPEATVVASSGYSTDPIMAQFGSYGFCGVVTKPYNVEDISEAISKALKKNEEKRRRRVS